MSATTSPEDLPWAGRDVLVVSPVPTHPTNFGNRGRIFQVCARLKERGARVHFLHYPSDGDWRTRLPLEAQAAMAATWDSLFTAPVTRRLHSRPEFGLDHAADSWWDPAIGQMLDWIFRVQPIDACVVNYTWLSHALEHCPQGVLRVLDTHDKFTGRRQLLESHGIRPEYFHLTAEEERTALRRAEVVWAIKEEEEEFFRGLAGRPVYTLPHAEPLTPVPAPETGDGVLRLGIAGGRNRVNEVNLRAFLGAAHAYLRRTLLPVEIVVAGSVCELIESLRLPFLRKLGVVESMDELYAAVDVVLAPLEFSTGLKIKVGEALARGKPIVAHAHAFEGYAAAHPFHRCASFDAMLQAVHRMVREPALVEELRAASLVALDDAAARVTRALDLTAGHLVDIRRSFVVVLPGAEAREGSLVLDHALEAGACLARAAPVSFLLVGPLEGAEAASCARLRAVGKVLGEPDPAATLGPRTREVFGRAAPRVTTLAALMEGDHHGFWFAALPDPAALGRRAMRVATVSLGALALRERPERVLEVLPALAERFAMLRLVDVETSPLGAQAAALLGAPGHAVVPLLWQGEQGAVLPALRRARPEGVAVLCDDPAQPGVVPVLALLTRVMALDVEVLHGAADAALPPLPVDGPLAVDIARVTLQPLRDYGRRVVETGRRPRFVVDLGGAPGAWRELFWRAGVPRLAAFDPTAPAEFAPDPGGGALRARGFVSAALAIQALHADQTAVSDAAIAARFAAEAGWARIQREAEQVVQLAGAAAA